MLAAIIAGPLTGTLTPPFPHDLTIPCTYRDVTSTTDYTSSLDPKQKQLLQGWRGAQHDPEDDPAAPLARREELVQDGITLSATRSLDMPENTQARGQCAMGPSVTTLAAAMLCRVKELQAGVDAPGSADLRLPPRALSLRADSLPVANHATAHCERMYPHESYIIAVSLAAPPRRPCAPAFLRTAACWPSAATTATS